MRDLAVYRVCVRLAYKYLYEAEGKEYATKFMEDVEKFGRVGQALMANLCGEDYERLVNSDVDPFYDDTLVIPAIQFLKNNN